MYGIRIHCTIPGHCIAKPQYLDSRFAFLVQPYSKGEGAAPGSASAVWKRTLGATDGEGAAPSPDSCPSLWTKPGVSDKRMRCPRPSLTAPLSPGEGAASDQSWPWEPDSLKPFSGRPPRAVSTRNCKSPAMFVASHKARIILPERCERREYAESRSLPNVAIVRNPDSLFDSRTADLGQASSLVPFDDLIQRRSVEPASAEPHAATPIRKRPRGLRGTDLRSEGRPNSSSSHDLPWANNQKSDRSRALSPASAGKEGRAEAEASAPPLSQWGQFPIFTGVRVSQRATPIEVAPK